MGIFACGLGLFNTFTLTFSKDISLEFRKAAQDIKKQFGERVVVVPRERQVFLNEFYGNAFCDQLADDVLQILEAAGKSVDGVGSQGVAFVQRERQPRSSGLSVFFPDAFSSKIVQKSTLQSAS